MSQINTDKHLDAAELIRTRQMLASLRGRDAKYYVIFSLLLNTGMRVSELLLLRSRDYDPRRTSLYITATKGSRDRTVPISLGLGKLISEMTEELDGESFIFNISIRAIQKKWNLIRPCKKKLHSLRHTFAIELYKKCRDIKLVQSALGHACIANTLIYADYIHRTEELREAMRGMIA